MYKLIFVDDEKGVLEIIKNTIDWGKMDIEVIGWCDDAISALEIMINEQADILVTDIKMPVMDGLELITRAKDMYPNIQCLVLSGYEEFELARMAMERGAKGYLLKPYYKEELEGSIKKCTEHIDKEFIKGEAQFEERQKKIQILYQELLEIDWKDTSKIQERMQRLIREQGSEILKEAALMGAILQEQSDLDFSSEKKALTKAKNTDEVITYTIQIFTSIEDYLASEEIKDPVVNRLVHYVLEHYDMEGLTLQYIARNVIFLNDRYLGRRFFNEMNIKFNDYLRKVRLDHAIEFLKDTREYNAEYIASRIGLGHNVHYFYRLFKQYKGMTMNEYRENVIKNRNKNE